MHIKDKIRVLVAEDNQVVAELIKQSLAKIGFEMIGLAITGSQAVEMTIALCPDVVLMDIEMPDLDGLEATKQIQRRQPTPVVILTIHEGEDLIEKASEVGASAYLTKPPKVQEIERAIIMALARHGDLMECWRLNRELEKALKEIKELQGILPICSSCKKIRDDKGYWNQIESYFRLHSEIGFTHSICPDCAALLYPDFNPYNKK
ncbi:MAG: response regulator [Proteobacteria bacterium]|nr:response regulator [Pseudomonadota bacterium]MBU1641610.1 response regulator [Pseudomonadota bacterium]